MRCLLDLEATPSSELWEIYHPSSKTHAKGKSRTGYLMRHSWTFYHLSDGYSDSQHPIISGIPTSWLCEDVWNSRIPGCWNFRDPSNGWTKLVCSMRHFLFCLSCCFGYLLCKGQWVGYGKVSWPQSVLHWVLMRIGYFVGKSPSDWGLSLSPQIIGNVICKVRVFWNWTCCSFRVRSRSSRSLVVLLNSKNSTVVY